MLRFARAFSGALGAWTGSGRSAYVCPTEACLEGLTQKGVLERALRTSVRPEERQALRQTLTCRLR
ncbi:YlxR family protein [bacterium]|nr:MAG: YlxR family protein [bacterium]